MGEGMRRSLVVRALALLVGNSSYLLADIGALKRSLQAFLQAIKHVQESQSHSLKYFPFGDGH